VRRLDRLLIICMRFKSDGYASLTRCVVHDDGCPFVVFETGGKGWITSSQHGDFLIEALIVRATAISQI